MFPIFSKIAAVYEQYRVNHLRLIWRTREYTASGSNVGAGLVLMATNYDPDDAAFATDTEMQNYWHCTSGAPYTKVMVHDVLSGHRKNSKNSGAKDATLNNYYVSISANAETPVTGAGKFYDIGLFQLATSGNVSSTDIIGELWVEYGFTMIHPKQAPGAPTGGAVHMSSIASTTADNFIGMVTQTGNTLVGVTAASNVITFPSGVGGNYFISVAVTGATSADGALNVASTTGTLLTLFCGNGNRDAGTRQRSLASTTGFFTYNETALTVPGGGCSITYTPSTIVGNGTTEIWIFAMPPTILTLSEEVKCSEYDEMKSRLERLESLLSNPSLSRVLHDSDEESPYEELERSIHLPRKVYKQLMDSSVVPRA